MDFHALKFSWSNLYFKICSHIYEIGGLLQIYPLGILQPNAPVKAIKHLFNKNLS